MIGIVALEQGVRERKSLTLYILEVGPFTEIKTGKRDFEMNEIRCFVCL